MKSMLKSGCQRRRDANLQPGTTPEKLAHWGPNPKNAMQDDWEKRAPVARRLAAMKAMRVMKAMRAMKVMKAMKATKAMKAMKAK